MLKEVGRIRPLGAPGAPRESRSYGPFLGNVHWMNQSSAGSIRAASAQNAETSSSDPSATRAKPQNTGDDRAETTSPVSVRPESALCGHIQPHPAVRHRRRSLEVQLPSDRILRSAAGMNQQCTCARTHTTGNGYEVPGRFTLN